VGGSVGAFFGGFISDRVVKRRGIPARMAVLMVSQVNIVSSDVISSLRWCMMSGHENVFVVIWCMLVKIFS